MNSLEYLAANNPAWSYISTVDPEAIQTKCQPCGIDGAPTREYALKIELVAAKRIQVREDPQHALLPACCVERHIWSLSPCLTAGLRKFAIRFSDIPAGWLELSRG